MYAVNQFTSRRPFPTCAAAMMAAPSIVAAGPALAAQNKDYLT